MKPRYGRWYRLDQHTKGNDRRRDHATMCRHFEATFKADIIVKTDVLLIRQVQQDIQVYVHESLIS